MLHEIKPGMEAKEISHAKNELEKEITKLILEFKSKVNPCTLQVDVIIEEVKNRNGILLHSTVETLVKITY